MPYLAQNAVPVDQNFEAAATFPPSGVYSQAYTRLDLFANGTDAIVQFLEAGEAWEENPEKEILAPMGFNSIPVETPFVAVRFKVWQNTLLAPTGTVHIRLFA